MTLLEVSTTIEAVPGMGGDGSGIDPDAPGFAACREITSARARNFYLGLRLAPEPRRSALLALYAWMREADDLADTTGAGETGATRVARLAEFGAMTAAVLEGRGAGESSDGLASHTPSVKLTEPRPTPPPRAGEGDVGGGAGGVSGQARAAWWAGFESMVRAYPVPASVFGQTLEALGRDARADVEAVEVRTNEELAWYMDRVAGTVAVACVSIWGLRRRGEVSRADAARAGRLAVLRARAVQLTNILRDLREDLDQRLWRSYLPRESYERHGLTAAGLLEWRDAGRCAAFVDEWIGEARRLYQASAELESVVEAGCARVCWALGAVYRALLEEIAREPRRVVCERVSVGRRRKMGIAVRGYLGVGLPG